jgi:tetratricopeptide (TPR) repeat protein
LERAGELDAGNPWICIERAGVLEQEDRYPDALRAAQMALEIHPWYRPAVQSVAHMLQLLDRDGEAMKLLEEANRRIESGAVAAQLTAAQMESQDYDGATQSLDRFVNCRRCWRNVNRPGWRSRARKLPIIGANTLVPLSYSKRCGRPVPPPKSPRTGKRRAPDATRVLQFDSVCAPASC